MHVQVVKNPTTRVPLTDILKIRLSIDTTNGEFITYF